MSSHLSLELIEITPLTRDISLFEFRAAHKQGELPPFTAGAHLSLELPSGLVRQYSLCNDPAEAGRYVVAVKREDGGRGGSREMHTVLRPGDILKSRAPTNHFPLAPAPAKALLIAGGIGVTPIMAMARSLVREGRPFHLLYLARSRAEAAFVDEIQVFGAKNTIQLHFDDEAGGLFDLKGLLALLGPEVHLHCCGPTPLMNAVRAAAEGWAEDRLHFEFFVNDKAASEEGDQAFTLELSRSKRSVEVAAQETPLAALLRAGIDVDYSCSEGTCGTCITRVLEGEVDHRDAVLSPTEKAKNIVLCCSRAKGKKLVIDL